MKYLNAGIMAMMAAMCMSCASTMDNEDTEQPEGSDPKPIENPVVQTSITGMSPANGKAGTVVTIHGTELSSVTYVCFNQNCVAPSQVSSSNVTAVVPEGAGNVYVSVVNNGHSLGAGNFTYVSESSNPMEVDWCQLSWVKSVIQSGEALEVNAQVYEKDITGQQGSHQGIFSQVGYANYKETNLSQFKWYNAVLNTSFAGEATLTNDEYMANKLILPDGKYRVVYRFSLDGDTWLYCDNGGSTDGFSIEDAGMVTVSATPDQVKTVDWCRIVNGTKTITNKPGEESEIIYAQAYVPECTGEPDHCSALQAQIGYGLVTYSTAQIVGNNYIWTNASLNASYKGTDGGEKYDEFMGSVSCSQAGSYAIVYRMTLDGGDTWTYCDTVNDVKFNVTDGIRWNVAEENKPAEKAKTIGWCRSQWPSSITTEPGMATEEIYGRVYIESCTGKENGSGCAGVKAQVGYGAATADVSTYQYIDAAINTNFSDSDSAVKDEYVAKLTPTAAGEYRVVYRFSVDGGNTWEYCDNDEAPGFISTNTTPMYVQKYTWGDGNKQYKCGITQGSELYTASAGAEQILYGQIYINGCTTGNACCDHIAGGGIYYVAGNDIENGEKIAIEGVLNPEFEKGGSEANKNNDEYMTTVQLNKAGTYRYMYYFILSNSPDDPYPQTVYCVNSWKSPDEISTSDYGTATIQ